MAGTLNQLVTADEATQIALGSLKRNVKRLSRLLELLSGKFAGQCQQKLLLTGFHGLYAQLVIVAWAQQRVIDISWFIISANFSLSNS